MHHPPSTSAAIGIVVLRARHLSGQRTASSASSSADAGGADFIRNLISVAVPGVVLIRLD